MDKDERAKKFMKILLPMIIVLSIIYIAKSGYNTGQWLYDVTH